METLQGIRLVMFFLGVCFRHVRIFNMRTNLRTYLFHLVFTNGRVWFDYLATCNVHE